jgi:hypothetical protein
MMLAGRSVELVPGMALMLGIVPRPTEPPELRQPQQQRIQPLFGRSMEALANGLESGDFNPLSEIGGTRSIQLAPKLQF